jgi:acetyl-CoA carboxylase carboxyltransferase component
MSNDTEPRTVPVPLQTLEKRREQARMPGSEHQLARRKEEGRLSAHERIERLLDDGTFTEIGRFIRAPRPIKGSRPYTDGVVTGWGLIDGRPVCVSSQDFTVLGGSLGEAGGRKLAKTIAMAQSSRVPFIAINDSAGARLQEGVKSLNAYGQIFSQNVNASGRVPQISVIMGPCAGGAAYSPALMDFTLMVNEHALMFITGSAVVKEVTGLDVSNADLGSARMHATKSGIADFVYGDELTCLDGVRELLSFLPANNEESPPTAESRDPVNRACPSLMEVPTDPKKAYDVRDVIVEVVDDHAFLETASAWARNIVCGFARIGGEVVGIVGNQPQVLAGVLDISASEKAARFVRTCDAFNVPLVTFVDTPGFLPGLDQEEHGIIRHGSKLAFAYCEATVPRIQVILRKAYGGAYIVMNSRSVGADVCFAWPTAEVAVMGPRAASQILKTADERLQDHGVVGDALPSEGGDLIDVVDVCAVDDVIEPSATRQMVSSALRALCTTCRLQQCVEASHGNIRL